MLDVLFAHSYYLRYDAKQWKRMKPYPPLATLYAAALIREQGYTVDLFDAVLSAGEHEFEDALAKHKPRYVVLYEDSFNFLIKMCLGRMREAAQRMAAAARDAGAMVIAASPDVTDYPEQYFHHGVQYAIVGEADNTLRELLDSLTGKCDTKPEEIAGLAMPRAANERGSLKTADRHPEKKLDTFPFAAWDLVDVERYRTAWVDAHGYFSINMVTTRGCPFHCNWCAKPIWGQQYAIRSPERVAEEMALIKLTVRPDHIWFADDIFGLRPGWTTQFAEEIAARDAVIPFMIQSRADLMTEKTVAALAKAGCVEVWMGAESGSQKILDAMEKGIDVAQVGVARARLRDAGIRACYFLQFGYPGEKLPDIMATVQMVRDTLPDDIGVSVSYPLPGTKFHAMVREQLGAKMNWAESNDLAMLFQGTYQTPFYRRLHTLIHDDLDLRWMLRRNPAEASALLDQVCDGWSELGRLEAESRSLRPTLLPDKGVALGMSLEPERVGAMGN